MNVKSSAQRLDRAPQESPDTPRSFRYGLQRQIRLVDISFGIPVLILAALVGLYIWMEPTVFTGDTLTSNLNDALPLILVAAGQTVVIIGGGIDISVGGVVSLIDVLAATHITGNLGGASMALWTLVLVAAGIAIGSINGLLIGPFELSPVVVTIATWSICGGISLFILASAGGAVTAGYSDFWTLTSWGLPHALIAIVILLVAWAGFRRTRTGMSIYAVGSDAEAARLTGVPVWRSRFLTYALSGGCSALAGLFLAANTSTGDPTVGPPFILNSIAAVVIGGTAITGGRGGISRSVLGSLIFIVIGDVIFAANVSSYLTPLITGLVLLAVVVVNAAIPTAADLWRRMRL
jgi:ribose transport system permease protein